MKFIHITDTHLLKDGELFHGFNTQKRFELCVRSINENHTDAHCIIVTGDLTERGEPAAYQFFSQQISTTGLPVYVIPGNHDDRENYRSQFPDNAPVSSDFAQSAIETPAGVFLLLDTQVDGSDAGSLCHIRRQWLRDQLNKYSSVPVFLFMHPPPFDLHLPGIDKIGLDAKDAFLSVVSRHANIRHIFFGHAHRPVSGHWQGISFSSMSGTNHQSPLDFKGAGAMDVTDNPEYAKVFIGDEQLTVHTHSYMNEYS